MVQFGYPAVTNVFAVNQIIRLYNGVFAITNIFFPVPWHFVVAGCHCTTKNETITLLLNIFMSHKKNTGQCLVLLVEVTHMQRKSNMADNTDSGKNVFPNSIIQTSFYQAYEIHEGIGDLFLSLQNWQYTRSNILVHVNFSLLTCRIIYITTNL